ncbi:7-alpha-hydroxysteroid dehydrogenase [Blastomyces silverae]|uniref:7-alpha-hydroxysteroid dehydrogenase n=1 Tax=Blastomyces silverae TaxID=2060906 RepID=A0A0H1BL30_9EURO|nr:7-alpha-hydroxysteroid dehydrogenase [Blastomyces silverae]
MDRGRSKSSSPSPSSTPLRSTNTPRANPHWIDALSLDLILRVLHRTILHPFIAWLIPLCLRAQATPYSHTSFIVTTAYAALLSLVLLLNIVNRRVAYGLPREVSLEDEVVVVAGGASGLGLLVAEIYGMRGMDVAVLDVRDLGAEEERGVEEWEEVHSVRYFKCDVGNLEEVKRVRQMIEKELGTPTILINCIAAPINGMPITSLSPADISRTIHANLFSCFNTLQQFLPGMLSSPAGGTIVTLSSVCSYLTPAGLSDYSATKAAIGAVHKTVEAELRASGDNERVKMLLVETGQMATPLFEDVQTPNNFLAPVLEPVQVARDIVAAVDSGNGGVIRLPAYATLVSWYAVLPVAIQRLARHLSGIDRAVGGKAVTSSMSIPLVKEKREMEG